jgi:anti-sigma factor RsiW
MNCTELARWIGPLLDGELDARNTVEVQGHLGGCPGCQKEYEVQKAMSRTLKGLKYKAPAALLRKIEPRQQQKTGWLAWAGWPVALATSAMLATVLLQQHAPQQNAREAEDIVAAHVRSLQASHLYDVQSSSHHTVKPWFTGKINFAPPVVDLSSKDFELVGGRLDYLHSQPVAAVVYRKHGHTINVLVGLPGQDLDQLPHSERVQGYNIRAWKQAGLDVVAISDIDPRELEELERDYLAPPTQTPDSR